jgi:hypothetical protein
MTPDHTKQPERTESVSPEPPPKKSSRTIAVVGKAKRTTHKKRADASQKPKALKRSSASKTDKVVALLERSKGASLNEMMKATGWQAHSVRGFLSATVKNKLHLKLVSEKGDKGTRRYRVKSRAKA